MRPVITHASQLEEHSSWRKYQAGLQELINWEAPQAVITTYKYAAARDCFLAFADQMKNGGLKVVEFHEIIGSAFEDLANKRYRRLIVSCPPRSGKSMLATMFVAWLLGRDQETQHIIASYGQTLSGKFHREAISMLKTPAFKRIFPEWKGFSPDSKFDMRGGGYILPTSVGGVLTGFTAGTSNIDSPGVGSMVIDDPLKDSTSKAALEALESWWGEQASTRRTNHWCQLVIATRFHERDLHGVLMEADGIYDDDINRGGWRWINIAGLIETADQAAVDPLDRKIGETHWPSNTAFTVDMLMAQKRTMGSFAFSALYQGAPVAAEGQIVRHGWIITMPKEEMPTLDVTWLGIDCAFEEDQLADESVICVAGISHRDPTTVYIKELIKGRWGFPDLCAAVKQAYAFHKAKVLAIEKAAAGRSLIQVLKKETKMPIEEMKPLKSKTIRLQAVCPMMEAGRVKFAEGEWTESFIKELTSFPFVKHDDCTDAFTWALTYYAMKLDAVDRGVQDAIIVNKKFRGNLRRPGLSDNMIFPEISRGSRSRGLFTSDNLFNDPDFSGSQNSADPRQPLTHRSQGFGRGDLRFDERF
jgi:predicted phage terminase large subunit-like protein